ncbi:MAG: DegV family protein, partial [Dehalococcoidia bacterium]|nr:DegV family protein [Dehalococcoidia bacterium]
EQFQGDCRIEMVDSFTGSLGLGLIAKAANEAAQPGASIEEVVEETQLAIPRVQFFGLLDTLEYLEEKGGRTGKRLRPLFG